MHITYDEIRIAMQLLAVLGSIQLALAAEDAGAAEALLPQADSLLASLGDTPPATVPDAAENAAEQPALAISKAQLRLQHRVLRVCMLLAAGRTGVLQKPGAANAGRTRQSAGALYSQHTQQAVGYVVGRNV